MKIGAKILAVALSCLVAGVYNVSADDSIELLKPWKPEAVQIVGLGPWILAIHNGASACISATNDAGKNFAIVVNVVAASNSGESWHLDLSQGKLKFKQGMRYKVSFSVKGSCLSQILVGLAKNHEPWDLIQGCEPKAMNVTEDWQECSYVFTVGENDNNGRLSFSNFNTSGATLFLADVSLKELSPTAN